MSHKRHEEWMKLSHETQTCILFKLTHPAHRTRMLRKFQTHRPPILQKIVAILMMNLNGFGLEILVFKTSISSPCYSRLWLWILVTRRKTRVVLLNLNVVGLGPNYQGGTKPQTCSGLGKLSHGSPTWPRDAAFASNQRFLWDRLRCRATRVRGWSNV